VARDDLGGEAVTLGKPFTDDLVAVTVKGTVSRFLPTGAF